VECRGEHRPFHFLLFFVLCLVAYFIVPVHTLLQEAINLGSAPIWQKNIFNIDYGCGVRK
jgi:hypothetical protein